MVLAARDGDAGAQGRLLTRFDPLLRGYLHRKLGGERFRAEGEDLLQEIRLAVVKGLPAFRGRDRAALVAWLRRITQRKTIDWERRRRARRRGPGGRVRDLSATDAAEVPAGSETPSQHFLRKEELEGVLRALETLPETYRNDLRIVLTEAPEPQDLAARLGRGQEATRKLVSRALQELRRVLGVR